MTKVTSELIDATYDAITLMSFFAQRLSEGEVSDHLAGEMSWLLGSTKRRLEPVIVALEEIETDQRQQAPSKPNEDELNLLSEIMALTAKFNRRRQSLKEASE
jgi:hypothetical protein